MSEPTAPIAPMSYVILQSKNADELMKKVNEFKFAGFEEVGGVAVSFGDGYDQLYQAMRLKVHP